MIETELKFRVKNPRCLLAKLLRFWVGVSYVDDIIYNRSDNPKIRERQSIVFRKRTNRFSLEREITLRLDVAGQIKTIEERPLGVIPAGYKVKNGYDKIRFTAIRRNCKIELDFYSFGVFCEIEGNPKIIIKVASELGFEMKDNLIKNIDTLFVEHCRKLGKKAPLFWGFNQLNMGKPELMLKKQLKDKVQKLK